MYLDHMEKGGIPPDPLKMDLIVLILDIFFYVMITFSYIILLIRISIQLNRSVREILYGERRGSGNDEDYYNEDDYIEDDPELTVTTIEGGSGGSIIMATCSLEEEENCRGGHLTRF